MLEVIPGRQLCLVPLLSRIYSQQVNISHLWHLQMNFFITIGVLIRRIWQVDSRNEKCIDRSRLYCPNHLCKVMWVIGESGAVYALMMCACTVIASMQSSLEIPFAYMVSDSSCETGWDWLRRKQGGANCRDRIQCDHFSVFHQTGQAVLRIWAIDSRIDSICSRLERGAKHWSSDPNDRQCYSSLRWPRLYPENSECRWRSVNPFKQNNS